MNTPINLPFPLDLPGIAWRHPVREDAPAMHALLQAIEKVEPRAHRSELNDRYIDFDDADSHPETDALLAFTPTGDAVAIAWVEYVLQEGEQDVRTTLWGEVHPAHRQKGLGTFVMDWMEARARQIIDALTPGAPGVMRTYCMEKAPDRVRLVRRFGFQPVRYISRMRRDLSQPLPEKVPPPGVKICGWTPELDHQTWIAFNQSFQDLWGFTPAPEDSWKMWISEHYSSRPDLSFLALQDGQVVSFCMSREHVEEDKALGFREAWIRDVGTRQAWRKQGLASVLMTCAMQAARQAGFAFVGLTVDSENPTGALLLYQDLGFETIARNIVFEKPT